MSEIGKEFRHDDIDMHGQNSFGPIEPIVELDKSRAKIRAAVRAVALKNLEDIDPMIVSAEDVIPRAGDDNVL